MQDTDAANLIHAQIQRNFDIKNGTTIDMNDSNLNDTSEYHSQNEDDADHSKYYNTINKQIIDEEERDANEFRQHRETFLSHRMPDMPINDDLDKPRNYKASVRSNNTKTEKVTKEVQGELQKIKDYLTGEIVKKFDQTTEK